MFKFLKINLLILLFQLGKRIGQLTLIVDLENLGLQHLWKPGIDQFTQVNVHLYNWSFHVETHLRPYVQNS